MASTLERAQERLAKLRERETRLQEQIKKVSALASEEERKQRTSRLVRASAELFSILGREIEEKDIVLLSRFAQRYKPQLEEFFSQEPTELSEHEFSLVRGEYKERFSKKEEDKPAEEPAPEINPNEYPSEG